jgi:dolichol-phosphate mannosyltransferase
MLAPASPDQGEAPILSVVVPLYNEEATLPELYRRLTSALEALGMAYELVLVDDGSQDATPQRLDHLHETDARVVGLHLTRNFGHQAAISAGLDRARGAAVVVMDGDLQDPPEFIEQLVEPWRAGYEVVYAVRAVRPERFWKRAAYFCFYRLLRAISDLDIPVDSGDFCLMDRQVVDVLCHLPERMRFIRGLRSYVGFRQVGVPYRRAARAAGEPKYTCRALVGLAVDGLVSFSSVPLNLVSYLGAFGAALTALFGAWVVLDAVLGRRVPAGWSCTLLAVLFLSTLQLVSLGIVGEYVRRIFLEVKGRPAYIVRDIPRRHDSCQSRPRGKRPHGVRPKQRGRV